MNTHIQVRNVPAALHRKLKIRAAEKGMTLSDYLKKIIAADAEKPTLAEMTERLRKLPPVVTAETAADIIRRERDSR